MKIGKLRMGLSGHVKNEKDNAFINMGDPIQAYAMSEVYDNIGINNKNIVLMSLDEIKTYSGDEIIFPLPLNLSIENINDFFPISPKIHPAFVSQYWVDDFLHDRCDIVEYLKKHEPIGCRDEKTRNLSTKYGIKSFLMGDYAIVFRNTGNVLTGFGRKTFLVDLSPAAYAAVPNGIKSNSKCITHTVKLNSYPLDNFEDDRLYDMGKQYISQYKNEAALVISSRIHAVVPAMSMGIPVILMADNIDYRFEWLDKFIPLYQEDDYEDVNWNPNPVDVSYARELVIDVFRRIISGEDYAYTMEQLDSFYMARPRSQYYGTFIKRLNVLKKFCGDSFRYCIWGAGIHCSYVVDLMEHLYPAGQLACIVDKYKRGVRYGVNVIGEAQLDGYEFDVCIISSAPAREDAYHYLSNRFNDDYRERVVEMCSTLLS